MFSLQSADIEDSSRLLIEMDVLLLLFSVKEGMRNEIPLHFRKKKVSLSWSCLVWMNNGKASMDAESDRGFVESGS